MCIMYSDIHLHLAVIARHGQYITVMAGGHARQAVEVIIQHLMFDDVSKFHEAIVTFVGLTSNKCIYQGSFI